MTMIVKLEEESNKQYQAFCDYWRLGAGRTIKQLQDRYEIQNNPPSKSYMTLHNWSQRFDWKKRIEKYIVKRQEELEAIYNEKQVELVQNQFVLLDHLYAAVTNSILEDEDVSLTQYQGAIKTWLVEFRNTFNLNPVAKVARTDPDGKKLKSDDISDLLKLADAAKRRPEEN